MSRPYGTALFAVVLASLVTGIADAKSTVDGPTPTVAAALQSGADRNTEDAARVAPPSNAGVFVVSPEIREKLSALETESMMPTATSDLQMWSASPEATQPETKPEEKPAALADSVKKSDPIHRFARGIISRTSSIAMSLTRSAMRFIGTPYVFGGTSPSGFDCSGYTQHVFAMLGITLPRTADAQYFAGHATIGGMTTGDLVFFQTYEPGPSHVGIYVGAGKFIHSSSHGVMISRLGDGYWRSRYIGAKRIVAFH